MTAPQIDRIGAVGGAAAADAARALYGVTGPVIPNPIGVAADIGAEAARVAVVVSRAGAWISNPRNWIRVGYVAGGMILIGIGVAMIVQEGKAAALRASGVSNVIGIGSKIISKGRASATPA